MRSYLTPLRWFEDRLASLPTAHLAILSAGCLAVLGAVLAGAIGLREDLALLMADDGREILLALPGLLLLAGASLWLFSCLLAALYRRLLLRIKGI